MDCKEFMSQVHAAHSFDTMQYMQSQLSQKYFKKRIRDFIQVDLG